MDTIQPSFVNHARILSRFSTHLNRSAAFLISRKSGPDGVFPNFRNWGIPRLAPILIKVF